MVDETSSVQSVARLFEKSALNINAHSKLPLALVESGWNIRAHFSKLDLPAQLKVMFPQISEVVTPKSMMHVKSVASVGVIFVGLGVWYFAQAPATSIERALVYISRECFAESYSPECTARLLNSLDTESIVGIHKLIQEMQSFKK